MFNYNLNDRFLEKIATVRFSCECCRFDAVEVLEPYLTNGADINYRNRQGDTPLLVAIQNEKGYDIVKWLIEKGADVNAVDREGRSLFMLTCVSFEYDYDVIKLLIDNHVQLDRVEPDQDGLTCLELLEEWRPDIYDEIFKGGSTARGVCSDR